MTIAMIVGFGILLMGITSLVLGILMTRNANLPRIQKILVLTMSIFAFLWCGGYGFMDLSLYHNQAFAGRLIGLVGVYGFIVCCVRFFRMFCGRLTSTFEILWGLDWIMAVTAVMLMAFRTRVYFVNTAYGTAFYTSRGIGRYFAFLFIAFNVVLYTAFVIKGFKKARYKRQKKILEITVVTELVVLLLSILDGLMPAFNVPSVPASTIGVFVAMIIMYYLLVRLNVFSVSKSNVAKYIFENVDTPVLILDENMLVLSGNESASTYFDANIGLDEVYFYQLFEITKEDAKDYFTDIYGSMASDSLQLRARFSDAICEIKSNAVVDEYNEAMCMVVFVNDITKQQETIDKLKSLNTTLENQIEDKSRQMEEMTLQTITTLANFIDSKEYSSIGHSTRVASYSALIAKELGWSEDEVKNIHYVGLLHDIGKIGIPYEVLNKPSNLNKSEFDVMKKHAVLGGEILKDIKIMDNASAGAMYHHENYDGTGYPYGLKGDEIPLIARIIGIADAFDAMTSNRQYREHLDYETVKEEISKGSGKQFDPYIAATVLRMIDEEKLTVIYSDNQQFEADNLLSESSKLMARVLGEEIQHSRVEAETDYLTQIWNRGTGEKHISQYLKMGDGALVIVDLDNFKGINDSYGHQSGDLALRMVADILKMHAQNEYLCRLGGDEFLLFIRDVTSVDEVRKTLDAILHTYHSKVAESDILANTSLSIGVALSVEEGRSFEQLYRCADRALYYVKQNGKKGYSFHNRAELDSFSNNENRLDLERLATSIRNHVNYEGAYRVEYNQFLHVHEFIEKYAIRNKQGVQLALLTIQYKPDSSMGIKEKEHVMEELERSITSVLRGVDASTRFSSSQILLTLVDTEQTHVKSIVGRILDDFYDKYNSDEIMIEIESADITMRAS